MQKKRKPTDVVEDFRALLRADLDLRRAWIDNIAMSFKDEWQRDFNTRGFPTTSEQIHKVANEAATNFMTTLLASGESPQ